MATDTVEGADRASREKRPLALPLALAGAALLLFLLLVWPTFYRYPGDSDRHRVNRLTGKAQVYDKQAETWRPARGGRNSRGTGGSPYDARGPRSEGPAPGGEWWHDGKGSGGSGSGSGSGSRKAKGSQWWYSEGEERSEPPADGSPIGGSRSGGGGGRGGGGSPIGGSRTGGDSPVGDAGSGGGSPIGGD